MPTAADAIAEMKQMKPGARQGVPAERGLYGELRLHLPGGWVAAVCRNTGMKLISQKQLQFLSTRELHLL